jgi:hypothetical protein
LVGANFGDSNFEFQAMGSEYGIPFQPTFSSGPLSYAYTYRNTRTIRAIDPFKTMAPTKAISRADWQFCRAQTHEGHVFLETPEDFWTLMGWCDHFTVYHTNRVEQFLCHNQDQPSNARWTSRGPFFTCVTRKHSF